MEAEFYHADLHIHSKFSGGTSARMDFATIAKQAELKGLALVGTGDVFHPAWFDAIKSELVEVADGVFKHPQAETLFLLSVEVEDNRRVHHLILIPSLGIAEELRSIFAGHSDDVDLDGRASLRMGAPEIVDAVVEQGCLIGPAHAFTPWTSMYKEFDGLRDCYQDSAGKVSFLELGLSADSEMADRISELRELTFLSCSDAHSPWPDRLGREFNRFEVEELSFSEIEKAILRQGGRRISLNVGFDPRLGKYHRTACSRCFQQFSLEEAQRRHWRCERCGGWVKKGVWDRVSELAQFPEPVHPPHRPPYLRIAPLSEIVALGLGEPDPHSPAVQSLWRKLVNTFGNEISVLVDVPCEDLQRIADKRIAEVIKAFREGSLRITAGGGGKYGRLELPPELEQRLPVQRTLTEFGA
jgi:uncharacterized protein (TIGR00375 family)